MQSFRMLLNKSSLYKISILLIFILAVIIRIPVIDTTRDLRTGSDELVYHYAAENILKNNTLTYDREGDMFKGTQLVEPTKVLSPGYPLFIAIVYFFSDHSTQAVFIVQLILNLCTLWLIYRILCLLDIKKLYVSFSLLLASIYPGFIYNIDRMLTEQLFSFLLLAFVYFFLKGMQRNSALYFVISGLLVTSAIHVRALAFPLLILAIIFALVYMNLPKKISVRNVLLLLGTFCLGMIPWWIRNWLTFDTFMFFSEAGVNPKVWGAVPYYLDMEFTYNKTLEEILSVNIDTNPILYYKWRIFGFFQYMWGDLWDENLVHPERILKPFLILQQLIVVPCILLIPFIIKKCRWEALFISCIPLGFTLMNMPFHGLPRYVYPSVPFLFITLAVVLDIIERRLRNLKSPSGIEDAYINKFQKISDRWIRICYSSVATVFSLVLAYSVYIYAYQISGEMSEYRISKYMGIDVSSLRKENLLVKQSYTKEEISIENASEITRGSYVNNLVGPTIIRVNNKFTEYSDVVTEINFNISGGYFYDYMTVYWTGKNTPEITENAVYKYPINFMQKKQTIYIDDDVQSLMIVPTVFMGGEFQYNSIEINKYKVE
ncbi:glycosyltransferase family 39 protein [Paenibacillus sp. EZ-K15]|uniref:ArnT family glycosyltransferase n=1 Tax=Paenibacillus sp. EZ-K15 TaxID=2044275 RepID=UPI000BF4FB4A|nr:glycosyltransferase family 39 protein [Paenibacillus sp. EZ-K15]